MSSQLNSKSGTPTVRTESVVFRGRETNDNARRARNLETKIPDTINNEHARSDETDVPGKIKRIQIEGSIRHWNPPPPPPTPEIYVHVSETLTSRSGGTSIRHDRRGGPVGHGRRRGRVAPPPSAKYTQKCGAAP